ncbi:MAG: hypothetical protein WBO57_04955 [Gammaproteobacteria bacterium]
MANRQFIILVSMSILILRFSCCNEVMADQRYASSRDVGDENIQSNNVIAPILAIRRAL